MMSVIQYLRDCELLTYLVCVYDYGWMWDSGIDTHVPMDHYENSDATNLCKEALEFWQAL